MPPKQQTFKTPDGKEFTSRAEWRDYMMLTFYSFKNKVDEPEPLIKLPGSINGQMFDIADCKNSTLLILDHTEQVQIDQLESCRVFVAACASSIFIRNCSNCTFYTCCRQLRLRDINDCNFYIYSMAEVHIEFTRNVKFAPFNGGYPDHKNHLEAANLDIAHNLWYDIYDHNDPGKTKTNWSLIAENAYETPWFPLGVCEPAVPRTKAGSVESVKEDSNMQSFSLQQMMQDVQEREDSTKKTTPSPNPIVPPIPPATGDDMDAVVSLLKTFTSLKAGQTIKGIITSDFQMYFSNGSRANSDELEAAAPNISDSFQRVVSYVHSSSNDLAVAIFEFSTATNEIRFATATLVLENNAWKLKMIQK